MVATTQHHSSVSPQLQNQVSYWKPRALVPRSYLEISKKQVTVLLGTCPKHWGTAFPASLCSFVEAPALHSSSCTCFLNFLPEIGESSCLPCIMFMVLIIAYQLDSHQPWIASAEPSQREAQVFCTWLNISIPFLASKLSNFLFISAINFYCVLIIFFIIILWSKMGTLNLSLQHHNSYK